MDAQWLNENVGSVLAEALSELSTHKPEDPVDFVGKWLINYVDRKEEAVARSVNKGAWDEAKTAAAAAAEEKAAEEAKVADAKAAKTAEANAFLEKVAEFASGPSADELEAQAGEKIAQCLSIVQGRTAAENCAVAEKSALAEGERLTYKFATDAALVDEGRVLDSEDPCNITFDVFVADEEEEEEEEVELEEGQEPPPKPEKLPKFVHVENVLTEERMKFYGVPLLGSYLAVAIKYQSSIHADAIPEGAFDEPAEGAAEEKEAAAEEGEAKEGEGEGKAEEVAAPLVQANEIEKHSVLLLDTIGTNNKFGPAEIESAQRMALAIGKTMEAASKAKFQAELVLRKELMALNTTLAEQLASEELVAAAETASAAVTEAAALADDASDEDKAEVETRAAVAAAAHKLKTCSEQIVMMSKLVIAPSEAVCKVWKAVLLFGDITNDPFGRTMEHYDDLLAEAKDHAHVTADVFEKYMVPPFDAAGEDGEWHPRSWLPIALEGADAEALAAEYTCAGVMCEYLQALQAYYAAFDAKKAADEAKAAAEAEAKAAEEAAAAEAAAAAAEGEGEE